MAYTDKLRVVYGDYTLGVHGEKFDYIFSYAQGGLESIVKNGYEWLYRCPKPTFWRALTDNDRGSKFHIKSLHHVHLMYSHHRPLLIYLYKP